MLNEFKITDVIPGAASWRWPKSWRCRQLERAAAVPARYRRRILDNRQNFIPLDLVINDDPAPAEFAGEIDGNDSARPKRTADRDGNGIDQAAVDKPAAVQTHRPDDAGNGG